MKAVYIFMDVSADADEEEIAHLLIDALNDDGFAEYTRDDTRVGSICRIDNTSSQDRLFL